MYLDFYGLKELPFALTPDPRFIYFTPSHTEAMANLHYGIESGKGLIVVTGEVGTGKTTILRWMMHRLDRTVLVAYLFNPRMTVSEFYQYISSPRLLDVPRWDFHHQEGYWLEHGVRVSRAAVSCRWDNRASAQPITKGKRQPPRELRWGEGTADELCLAFLYATL